MYSVFYKFPHNSSPVYNMSALFIKFSVRGNFQPTPILEFNGSKLNGS